MIVLHIFNLVASCIGGWVIGEWLCKKAEAYYRGSRPTEEFSPYVMTFQDACGTLTVHSKRDRWLRRRWVACQKIYYVDGRPALKGHSAMHKHYDDAVWEANSTILYWVWQDKNTA